MSLINANAMKSMASVGLGISVLKYTVPQKGANLFFALCRSTMNRSQ